LQELLDTIKSKSDLVLQKADIDISHRLGKYKVGKHRPIIVKFERRQTKVELSNRSKHPKEHKIYVNEDLTKMNADMFASCRVKDKSNVEKV
jgi:hypothetical protein